MVRWSSCARSLLYISISVFAEIALSHIWGLSVDRSGSTFSLYLILWLNQSSIFLIFWLFWLSDFLILFFTEALFYCGVAVFLFLIDYLRRPSVTESTVNSNSSTAPQLGHRISSVAALVLSLIIPLVTMGFVWPWTGPAASATLAPHLVGIVVQFAFEQYARYKKSPSWPVIPIVFQVSTVVIIFTSKLGGPS